MMINFNTSVGGRNVKVNKFGVKGPKGIDSEYPQTTLTTTESGINIIDSFPISETRSCKYIILLSSADESQFGELHLVHDDVLVILNQVEMTTINQTIGTFSADIVDNNVELSCDVVYPETNVKFKRIDLTDNN